MRLPGRRGVMRGLALAVVLLLGLFHAPVAAQAPTKVWRIGFLGDGSPGARAAHTLEPVRDGLRDLGYVEGRNITLDARWSEGSRERLVENAAEFVRQKVDLTGSVELCAAAARGSRCSPRPLSAGVRQRNEVPAGSCKIGAQEDKCGTSSLRLLSEQGAGTSRIVLRFPVPTGKAERKRRR